MGMVRLILTRCLLVGFWVFLIAGLLYSPRLFQLAQHKKSINIFIWGSVLTVESIEDFERETGIHVNVNYFLTNEELLAKMRATNGQDIDLIMPSDYAVAILRSEDFLKKIDKSRLPFLSDINSLLLGHPFDKNNEYCLPFEWEMYGFGINRKFFNKQERNRGWSLVFDTDFMRKKKYRITMVNDPLEGISFAGFYLYKDDFGIYGKKLDNITHLLREQRAFVEAYTDVRADYYLQTETCPLVIANSADIWRAVETDPAIDFVVPQEGTFMTIEHWAIPAKTTKDDCVYAFLNYVYTKRVYKKQFNTFRFFPVLQSVVSELDVLPQHRALMQPTAEQFSRYHFIRPLVSEQEKQEVWISVKS